MKRFILIHLSVITLLIMAQESQPPMKQISVELRAEFFQASDEMNQAKVLYDEKSKEFGEVIDKIQKECGKDYQVQQNVQAQDPKQKSWPVCVYQKPPDPPKEGQQQ